MISFHHLWHSRRPCRITFGPYLLCLAAALCASRAHAQRLPTVSQRQVEAIAAHWQHVLKLDDWRIHVQIVSLDGLEDGTYAGSLRNRDTHVILIRVLRPADYAAFGAEHPPELRGKAIRADIEDSIVHELVHLRLDALTQADEKHLDVAEEYTVVRLTEALLAARKK
jgi:hypothetical protein